jgi:hypothetical protein
VAADAAPTSEKPNPAAPNAGTAIFAARFRFVASFVCDIDISSMTFERFVSIRPTFIVRLAYNARKAGEVSCVTQHRDSIHLYEYLDRASRLKRHNRHALRYRLSRHG